MTSFNLDCWSSIIIFARWAYLIVVATAAEYSLCSLLTVELWLLASLSLHYSCFWWYFTPMPIRDDEIPSNMQLLLPSILSWWCCLLLMLIVLCTISAYLSFLLLIRLWSSLCPRHQRCAVFSSASYCHIFESLYICLYCEWATAANPLLISYIYSYM